jgi:hypothetical protein
MFCFMGQFDSTYSNSVYAKIPEEFEKKAFSYNLLLGCFGEEYISFLVPQIFSFRGWDLYEKNSSLTKMVSEGNVETIEFGKQYTPLPSGIGEGNFIIPESIFSFFESARKPPLFIEIVYDPDVLNDFKARGVNIHPIESLSFNKGFLDLIVNPEIAKTIGLFIPDKSNYTFKIPKNYLPFIAPQIRTPKRLGKISKVSQQQIQF